MAKKGIKNLFSHQKLKFLMSNNQANIDQLITHIIQGIEDVKGNSIEIIDLRELENTVCDYFIVCSGNSNTQVDSIESSVRKTVSKALQDKPWHVEGLEFPEQTMK